MKNLQIGIWLDFKEAYIVQLDQEKTPTVKHLISDVEHPAVKGGTRSKTPWGPQYSPSDERSLERAKHAEQEYFDKIMALIPDDPSQIVIFGPAEAKVGLKKKIESKKQYKPELAGVYPSDYLSENQIVALMRDYYSKNESVSG